MALRPLKHSGVGSLCDLTGPDHVELWHCTLHKGQVVQEAQDSHTRTCGREVGKFVQFCDTNAR